MYHMGYIYNVSKPHSRMGKRRKSVTVRDDQSRYIADQYLNFSGWARAQIHAWLRDNEKVFPCDESQRPGPMVQKHVYLDPGIIKALNHMNVNLSHFVQDRLDEKMQRDRKLNQI